MCVCVLPVKHEKRVSLRAGGSHRKRVECEHSDSEQEALGVWSLVLCRDSACCLYYSLYSVPKQEQDIPGSLCGNEGGGGEGRPQRSQASGRPPPGPYLSSARREWCLSLVPLHGRDLLLPGSQHIIEGIPADGRSAGGRGEEKREEVIGEPKRKSKAHLPRAL